MLWILDHSIWPGSGLGTDSCSESRPPGSHFPSAVLTASYQTCSMRASRCHVHSGGGEKTLVGLWMPVTFIFSFNPNSEILMPTINPLTFLWRFLPTVENNSPHTALAPVTYRELADILTHLARGPGPGNDSEAPRRDERLRFSGLLCPITVLSIEIAANIPEVPAIRPVQQLLPSRSW